MFIDVPCARMVAARTTAHSPRLAAQYSRPNFMCVPLANRGDEIFVERAPEIVARREPPVAPRRAVVDVHGPGVDDRLPLVVGAPRDARVRKRLLHHLADLLGRRV